MKPCLVYSLLITLLLSFVVYHCNEESYVYLPTPSPLPDLPTALPFEITRTDQGTPLTQNEVETFTRTITAAWKNADFFRWLENILYGLDESYDEDMPYYASLWDGVHVVKSGDLLTFEHIEGASAENMMIKNSVLLMNIIAIYSATGDERIARIANKLARGISATMMGSVWDDSVPQEDRYVMARSVINHDHQWTTVDGYQAAVDYSAWRQKEVNWNMDFVHIPNNPYWGDIWIQNKRSKDDVCRLYRAAAYMAHFLDIWPDDEITDGINNAYYDLKGFAQDVVEYDYHIRSVDHDGTLFIPDQDLASFVDFTWLDPDAECNARISSEFLANDDPGEIDCNDGICELYEDAAIISHLWSYNLIRNFHISALLLALNNSAEETTQNLAYNLMQGLITRLENEMQKVQEDYHGTDQESYERTLAGTMVGYATCGVPLTSEEIRFVQGYYEASAEDWNNWPYFDLWDESHGDGTYSYRPGGDIRFENMTAFMQLCASPYYNDNDRPIVDCDIVLNPERWGE